MQCDAVSEGDHADMLAQFRHEIPMPYASIILYLAFHGVGQGREAQVKAQIGTLGHYIVAKVVRHGTGDAHDGI